MGLKDIVEQEENSSDSEDNSQSSSSGSSSRNYKRRRSSTPDDEDEYPIYQESYPYAAVHCGKQSALSADDSDFTFEAPQQTVRIERIMSTKNSSWELSMPSRGFEGRPDNAKYWWSTRDELDQDKRNVQKYFGEDLLEILNTNPTEGVRLVKRAKERHKNEGPKPEDENKGRRRRTCQVCGDRVDPVTDDFEVVNDLAVHGSHTVSELLNADVLDD